MTTTKRSRPGRPKGARQTKVSFNHRLSPATQSRFAEACRRLQRQFPGKSQAEFLEEAILAWLEVVTPL